PALVRRVKVVRRDENLETMRLGRLEEALHVLNCPVFEKTFVDEGPREASFPQDLILWVDNDDGGVALVDVHSALLGGFVFWALMVSDRPAVAGCDASGGKEANTAGRARARPLHRPA